MGHVTLYHAAYGSYSREKGKARNKRGGEGRKGKGREGTEGRKPREGEKRERPYDSCMLVWSETGTQTVLAKWSKVLQELKEV